METEFSKKRDWNKQERRKADRRKDGTPEERKFLADCKRVAKTSIPSQGELPPKKPDIILIAVFLGLLLITILGIAIAHADELINMQKISTIESNNNPDIISHGGDYGLFQISKPVLVDFKRQFDNCGPVCLNIPAVAWQMPDMLNPTNNTEVAEWYLTQRIPEMLRHYHKPVTTRNIIIAWNAGISYVIKNKRLPKTTINYLRKYGIK